MSTSSSKGQKRKREIVAVAKSLFATQGFESTTMHDIVTATGIAKGTFYHHFKSKDELLEVIVTTGISERVAEVAAVAGRHEVDITTRFFECLLALNQPPDDGFVLAELHRSENLRLHDAQNQMFIREVTPILAGLVAEGVSAGLFSTPYPYETVELFVIYVLIAFDYTQQGDQEALAQKLVALLHNFEVMLGAPSGFFEPILAHIK